MKPDKTNILISLLLSLLFFPFASPCSDYSTFSIDQLSVEDGLSNKTITAIIQDKEGFMWFGTESGLNRYDGYNFKIFKNDPGDPHSLSNNRISCLFVDGSDRLWVCTSGGGICRYRKNTEDFIRIYPVPENMDSKANIVLSAFQSRDGDIWFGTWEEGLLRYKPASEEFRSFKSVHGTKFDFSNHILRIYEDSSLNLWTGTRDGLYIFNRTSESFLKLTFSGEPKKKYSVTSIYEDSYGLIWVGTYHGLFLADPGNLLLRKPEYQWIKKVENTRVYTIFEDRFKRLWIGSWSGLFEIGSGKNLIREYTDTGNPGRILTSSIILSMHVDRNGVFWVGTMNGLNYFNGNISGFKSWDMRKVVPGRNKSCFFTTILEDFDGTIWLGTLKKGLINFDRTTGEINNIKTDHLSGNSYITNVIMSLKMGTNGDLYIGTSGGFSIRKKKTGRIFSFVHDPDDDFSISHNEIISIFEYRKGFLLLGTMGGLNLINIETGKSRRFLNESENPDSISANVITFLLQDKKGRIWVGTYGGGLNLFIPESQKFERIREPEENGIRRAFIYPAIEAYDGMLWMGSNEAGLKMFDPEKRIFRNFSIGGGLRSKTVWDVLEDTDGNIWFSTSEGISRLNRDDYSITNFNTQDGMLINFFNFNSGTKGRSGEMFFSGENGFVSFFPRDIVKTSFEPRVVITSIRKQGEKSAIIYPGSSGNRIKISHSDLMFSIEFSALSFLNSGKNCYKYRLKGLNDEWVYIGSDHSVTFGHLSPGDYTFNVTGSNCFGDWNEKGASLQLKVIPAIWQTGWFLAVLIILTLTGVILIYRNRVRIIEKKLRDETEMEKLFKRKGISKREKEIILLVINGMTSREIEDKLFISYGTVKNHIYNIYKKLNVKNRAEIVNLFKDIKNI